MSYIFVGLGNPGKKYAGTRHNVGRDFLTALAKNPPSGFEFENWQENKKAQADICQGSYNGQKVLLVLPNTYMNLSGKSVGEVSKYKNDSELVVLHDDIDMPLGSMKIVYGRGSGGNKGVESIAQVLGSGEFARFKIGVLPVAGDVVRKPSKEKINSFVLSRFGFFEKLAVKKMQKKVLEAIEVYLKEGRERAMNKFN